jgi:hypothetical protein
VLANVGIRSPIVTKSLACERDLDIVGEMGVRGMAAVYVSLTTLDPNSHASWSRRAAAASAPAHDRGARTRRRAGRRQRFTDDSILNEPSSSASRGRSRCGRDHGVQHGAEAAVEVNPLFQQWLEAHFSDGERRAIMARVRDMRGGKNYDSTSAPA